MDDLFVDTNVFLRVLTSDDPGKARRAQQLFERAVAGEITLRTSLLVVAEIVWTLESYYELDRADVADKIAKILNTPNLRCEAAAIVRQAVDLYAERHIDFIDAYHACALQAEGATRIVTFDQKHFRRMDWLEILEP
jgi:predicted nucleic-acid-binding protein